MLNNDTEPEPAWLQELVSALDRHPEAGSAASRLMIYSQRDQIHSAGDKMGKSGVPDSRGVWARYGPPYDREAWVFGGCGGAVAYRREMLDEIGLFDERFFMYLEDADLNWRAQLRGWRSIYVPTAIVYHHLSATGGGRTIQLLCRPQHHLDYRPQLSVAAAEAPLAARRRRPVGRRPGCAASHPRQGSPSASPRADCRAADRHTLGVAIVPGCRRRAPLTYASWTRSWTRRPTWNTPI